MNRILVYGIGADKLGGIETFLFNMNRFMTNNTIFDYIIEGSETIHNGEIEKKGGRVFFISPKREIISNINDWKKLLKEKRSDYSVIYFNMFSLAWIFPVFMAINCKYKVFVHAHNNNLHDCGFIQKFMHRINRFVQMFLNIQRLTNSNLSSKFFFGSKDSTLVYNAIDTERFKFDERKRQEFRQKIGIPEETIVSHNGIREETHLYGFAGRLEYEKNPIYLIHVFNEINKMDSNAYFLVCGTGTYTEEMKKLSAKYNLKITFTGLVSNLEDYYSAMDCFILPSKYEGLGIVLIEAQCTGLPCVVSADVIPQAAKVTELLEFVKLDGDYKKWADVAMKIVCTNCNRESIHEKIEKSSFNIRTESKSLENILLN